MVKPVKVIKHQRGAKKRTKAESIKQEINRLLYQPTPSQRDKELLTITILSSKAHHFRFLQAYTHFNAVGEWKQFKGEKNTMIEIEFKDTKDERVGNRLMALFERYNGLVVHEDLLYVRTEPIEDLHFKMVNVRGHKRRN